jgi:hypothetical protein
MDDEATARRLEHHWLTAEATDISLALTTLHPNAQRVQAMVEEM